MNLYIWTGYIVDTKKNHAIYALADDLEQAQKIAVQTASALVKDIVKKIVEKEKPVIHDKPYSFIKAF